MSESRPMTSILFPNQPAPFAVVDSEAREGVSQLAEDISCDEPYKQLVTDGEGKTVWEDRLAYSTEGKVYLFNPQQITMTFYADEGLWVSNELSINMEAAVEFDVLPEKVMVDLNGETMILSSANGSPFYGNMKFNDPSVEDNGESAFLNLEQGLFFSEQGEETSEFSCYASGIKVKKIDPAYIPDGVKRVMNFLVIGETTFKEVDADNMDHIFVINGNPLLIIGDAGAHWNSDGSNATVGKYCLRYGFQIEKVSFKFDSNNADAVLRDITFEEALTDSIVLWSSDIGSGNRKRFRITVNDSGTITATEVTE